jgi:hypothetical protein
VPRPARVRFISMLEAKASVELVYDGRLVEAEVPRDQLDALKLRVGSHCAVQLRLPFVFPRDV